MDVQNHSHQNQKPLENLHNKQEDAENDQDYNVLKKTGLHFVHINKTI